MAFLCRKVDKMSKKRIVHGDCFTFYTKYVINVRKRKITKVMIKRVVFTYVQKEKVPVG